MKNNSKILETLLEKDENGNYITNRSRDDTITIEDYFNASIQVVDETKHLACKLLKDYGTYENDAKKFTKLANDSAEYSARLQNITNVMAEDDKTNQEILLYTIALYEKFISDHNLANNTLHTLKALDEAYVNLMGHAKRENNTNHSIN